MYIDMRSASNLVQAGDRYVSQLNSHTEVVSLDQEVSSFLIAHSILNTFVYVHQLGFKILWEVFCKKYGVGLLSS